MRVSRACAHCNSPFEAVAEQGARFCSGTCFRAAHGQPAGKDQDYAYWCEVHWAPVRDNESLSKLAAPVVLMQAWMDSESVARRNDDGHAGPAALDRLARQDSPICCHLGDREMQMVYAASAVSN